jgi:glycosyltransferase involved in cell wall biosynthesis
VAEFLGRVGDAALERLYPRALALVVPNVEEFGITAVEAQAAGRPVVGWAAGGTRETVVDGVTGVLVDELDVEALAEVLRETDFRRFDAELLAVHARRFSVEAFQAGLRHEVARALGQTTPVAGTGRFARPAEVGVADPVGA